MTLTKEQLLGLSEIHDGLFSDPDLHEFGQPCDHPGCASHLSRPCEGCGRYGAGLRNGPDIDAGTKYIEKLGINDAVISSFLILRRENGWTWVQTLMAMVIKQNELIENLEGRLHEAIINRTSLSPFASPIDKPE